MPLPVDHALGRPPQPSLLNHHSSANCVSPPVLGLGPGCWSLKAHRPRHKHRTFEKEVVVWKASLQRVAAASFSGSPDDFPQQGPWAGQDSSSFIQASASDPGAARPSSSLQAGASGSSSSDMSRGPGSYRPDPYGPAPGTVVSVSGHLEMAEALANNSIAH